MRSVFVKPSRRRRGVILCSALGTLERLDKENLVVLGVGQALEIGAGLTGLNRALRT